MDTECPGEHHQRVMDCAQPVREIVEQIAHIDLHTEALLHNNDKSVPLSRSLSLSLFLSLSLISLSQQSIKYRFSSVDMLDRVCALVAEYSICAEGTSAACPVHPLIKQWKDVSFYHSSDSQLILG